MRQNQLSSITLEEDDLTQPCVTDLFEAAVARFPDTIAVRSQRDSLSYALLN